MRLHMGFHFPRVSLVVDWIQTKTKDGAFCDLPLPNGSEGKPLKSSGHDEEVADSKCIYQASYGLYVLKSFVGWNAWGAFSTCSKACGIRKKTRDRSCSGRSCGPRGHTQQTQERDKLCGG